MADNNTTPGPSASVTPANDNAPAPATTGDAKPMDARDQRNRQGGRGRGGRGRGRGGRGNSQLGRGSRDSQEEGQKKGRGERGRAEWAANPVDKRKRNDEQQERKRQKIEAGEIEPSPYTAEEIAAEARKPKHKVAVMIGYAGTGYKGMQINDKEKTIEGDLFKAFVEAGAISKANADDPKKSSLVRCARTDKGVHAAGNVISLKLIIEDPEVVPKINAALPAQIRVWGIQRTNAAFSCYQAVDSRWYEYLIPTHSFLPPHPQSFLGKKLVESAEQEGVIEPYKASQADVANFWEETEEKHIKPILEKLEPELREQVLAALHAEETSEPVDEDKKKADEDAADDKKDAEEKARAEAEVKPEVVEPFVKTADVVMEDTPAAAAPGAEVKTEKIQMDEPVPAKERKPLSLFELAMKEIKAAYITAKKAYRISTTRRERVQAALHEYVGTKNFHNYTIQKPFKDPSAKRHIKSFEVNPTHVYVNDTEWLSLKVHGQSFMMHQIRKMVAMATLVVRCGTSIERVEQSYGEKKVSIPKAPGLGLLLERPVFDSWNVKAVEEYKRDPIVFGNYEKEMQEFKQKEIYERIYREEEKDNQFHVFFQHIDHYKSDFFLWVTAAGIRAARQPLGKGEVMKANKAVLAEVGLDSEVVAPRDVVE